MALSSYYNPSAATIVSLHSDLFTDDCDYPNTELVTELEAELLGFCTNFDTDIFNDSVFSTPYQQFSYTDTSSDFDPDQFLNFDQNPVPLKRQICYENSFHSINVSEFDPNSPPKRQKCYENTVNSIHAPDYDPNPPQRCYENTLNSIHAPDYDPNPPQRCYVNTLNTGYTPISGPMIQLPGDFNFADTTNYSSNGNKEMSNVSPQTLAARTRRRKITDKTGELGKLVPGGNRMNTAEMLQSAFKYIKYLQASVSVFQSMGAFQEKMVANEGSIMEDLQVLLQSTIIQEKLYTEEQCIVPLEFIKVLAEDQDTKLSEPSIRDNINQLMIQLEKLGE